jgi:hypothetical protein
MNSSNDYRTSAASLFATQARTPRSGDEANVSHTATCRDCGVTATLEGNNVDGWMLAPITLCDTCFNEKEAAEILRTLK